MRIFLVVLISFLSLSAAAVVTPEVSPLPLPAEKLKDSKQLIWVQPTGGFQTTVRLFELNGNQWQEVKFSRPAVIGKGGFANLGEKVEGDKKSPQGLYPIGLFFSKNAFESKNPAIRLTAEDKWIDDPNHPDYNKWIRGATTAKSYENLLLKTSVYDYILVVNYNMNPIVPRKGSAIFLHVWASKLIGTMGCVALEKNDVETILRWLNPFLKPQILMGKL